MAGGSKSSSTPQDMTPQAYKNLQQPFAQTLASMLGFTQNPTPAPAQQYAPGTLPQGGGYQSSPYGNRGGGGGGGGANGGGDQGSGSGYQGFRPVQTPPPPASTYTGNTAGGNALLSGLPSYQGPLTADMTQNEGGILQQLMGTDQSSGINEYLQQLLGGQFMPGGAQGSAVGDVNAQGIDYNTSGADPYASMQFGNAQNPFLQAYTQAQQRTTMDQLTQALTRDLPGRFTQGGQFIQPQGSSAFDRAAALATSGAANAMGDIASNIGYNAYASDRGLQANAINEQQNRLLQTATGNASNDLTAQQANQSTALSQNTSERALQQQGVGLQQAQVQSMIANLQAQALPRLIQEQGIERGVAAFNAQVNQLMQTLGIAANVSQPTVANASKSETKPNLIPSIGLSA